MRIYLFFVFIVSAFSLLSCDEKRVFEKNVDFKNNDWYEDSVATFDFKIDDNTQKYNVDLNIRNAISYPFTNLYIRYYLTDSTNKTLESKLLRLPLFDKKSGKPFGDGLGDIFDHKFNLFKDYNFPNTGNYKMKVKQYMRQDPLPFVMAVGIRVEKAENNK